MKFAVIVFPGSNCDYDAYYVIKKHLKVERYVTPEQFNIYKDFALKIGFSVVESGPLVRSSYHADEQARLAIR